jgi:O-antigen/teichoic acid export membrane protein
VDSQSLKNRFVTGILWLGATKAAGQAITWAITIVVVRLLAPDDYGLMGMAVLFTGFLLLFNELGLGAAIIRYPALSPTHISDLRWAILAVNIGLFLAVLGLAPIVAAWFAEPRLTSILRVLGAIFVIQGLGVPSACLLQREMAFKRKSQAELLGNLAGGITTLACAAAGLRVWSLVAGYLLQQLTTNALYYVYHPVRFSGTFSFRNVRQFVNFGFQVASSKILWFGSSNADFLVVGRLLGTTQLGYYSLAFQFSSLPLDKIVSLVTQVAFPSFSSVQHDDQTLKRIYVKLVSTVGLITFPMFFGLLVTAESGVRLALTDKWTAVVFPLQILCIVSCLRAIETLNTPLLLARGRSGIVLGNNVLQAIVLPIGFVVGARYGLEGVALAWLVTWPGLYALVTYQTLQVAGLPVRHYLNALKHAAIGSALMAGGVTAVQVRWLEAAPPSVQFVTAGALGILLYVAYHLLFNRRASQEVVGMLAPASVRARFAAPVKAPAMHASLIKAE